MMAYHWPGNIRELETFGRKKCTPHKSTTIEDVILASVAKQIPGSSTNDESRMKTIHENERDYIISVLKKCNGRIWGAGNSCRNIKYPPINAQIENEKARN